MLSIQLPGWLSDFWMVYGDMITPILVTLMMSLLTYLALTIKSNGKVNAAKADLQIKALQEVANREDNKPELASQKEEIESLKLIVGYLGDMFNLAFQNSELSPEIKENLNALINKIKYGTEEDLLKELSDNNAKLKEQIAALETEISNNTVEVVEEKTAKRVRR